jgi:hypothetical protein
MSSAKVENVVCGDCTRLHELRDDADHETARDVDEEGRPRKTGTGARGDADGDDIAQHAAEPTADEDREQRAWIEGGAHALGDPLL